MHFDMLVVLFVSNCNFLFDFDLSFLLNPILFNYWNFPYISYFENGYFSCVDAIYFIFIIIYI